MFFYLCFFFQVWEVIFASVNTFVTITIFQLSTSFVLETFIHSKEKVRRSNSVVMCDVWAASCAEKLTLRCASSSSPPCCSGSSCSPNSSTTARRPARSPLCSASPVLVFLPLPSAPLTHPPPLSLPLTPSPTLSGSWTGWLTTTGGPCRSSSSVPIRSSDRSVRSLPEPVGRASPHWIKWHRIECLCLSHFGYICINTAA